MYSVRQLYDLFYKHAGIPITFDYHHHSFHPDELSEFEALQMAADTWPNDIRQCTHYSECRKFEQQRLLEHVMKQHGVTDISKYPSFAKMQSEIDKLRMQAHSDYIIEAIRTYDMPIDIMIEAKAKELALLKYRDIYVYNRKKEKVLL